MVGVDDTVSFTSENVEKSNNLGLGMVNRRQPNEDPGPLTKLEEESSGAQGH